jgi:DNA-binding CsgD family transcriptional regulator
MPEMYENGIGGGPGKGEPPFPWTRPERSEALADYEIEMLTLMSEGLRQYEVAERMKVDSRVIHRALAWLRKRRNFETNERLMFEFGRTSAQLEAIREVREELRREAGEDLPVGHAARGRRTAEGRMKL